MMLWLTWVTFGVLCSLGLALLRVWIGPGRADRMMAAQLAGTGGVAVLILIAALQGWAGLDVALILALSGALAAVGFVKATSPDGGGDPEEEDTVGAPPETGDRNADQ